MLIQSFQKHFNARRLEYVGAGFMASWGYYFVTHPQLMTDPTTAPIFDGLRQVAGFFGQPPQSIGVAALLTGTLRMVALIVNGAYEKTPLIRSVTAFASIFIWVSLAMGFWFNGLANPAIIIYPWLAIMDALCLHSAGYDLVIAENNARKVRSLNGHADNIERGIVRRIRRILFPSATRTS